MFGLISTKSLLKDGVLDGKRMVNAGGVRENYSVTAPEPSFSFRDRTSLPPMKQGQAR